MNDLHLNLLLAFVIPLGFLIIERLTATSNQPWITPNLLTDGCLGLFRILILGSFFAAYGVALQVGYNNLAFLNTRLLEDQPAWLQILIYFVVIDFAYYWFHRLTHCHTVFWVFHAVHHSQQRANPMLQNRSHPVEELLFLALQPVPLLVLGGSYPAAFWFLILDKQWSYFVHSDIKTNLGPLKYVVVTPQFHRVHHSAEHEQYDKNFGGRLIVWDWLFGTMWPELDAYPEIGISDYPIQENSRAPWKVVGYALGHLLYPFGALWEYGTTRPFFSDKDRNHDVEMLDAS